MKTKITLFIATLTLMFSVSSAVAQTEILTNGDFETGDVAGWQILEISDDLYWLMDNTSPTAQQPSSGFMDDFDVHGGTWAVNTTWGLASPTAVAESLFRFPLLSGLDPGNYTFSWWAMVPDGQAIMLRPSFDEYGLAYEAADVINPEFNDVWMEYSYDFTIDANTGPTNASVRPFNADPGANGRWITEETMVIFDDFSLIKHADPVASVEDHALDQAISFYPNPASHFISIDSKISLERVEIYSVLGKLVKSVNSDFNSISISELASGNLYVVKAFSEEGGIAVRKLIKQ